MGWNKITFGSSAIFNAEPISQQAVGGDGLEVVLSLITAELWMKFQEWLLSLEVVLSLITAELP